jgi:hypothetical protein
MDRVAGAPRSYPATIVAVRKIANATRRQTDTTDRRTTPGGDDCGITVLNRNDAGRGRTADAKVADGRADQ